MIKKNVLFISVSAPPKNDSESIQVAKYLKYLATKFSITLVTTPNYKGWRPKDNSLNHFLKNVKQIIEIKTFDNKYILFLLRKMFPQFLNKPDLDFSFTWQWRKTLKKIKHEPDLIYSRSAPLSSHILALKIKQKINAPWVMHLSDPWLDNPYLLLKGTALKYHQSMEQKCFLTADKITVTSLKCLDFYKRKYPHIENKFAISYNVFDGTALEVKGVDFEKPLTFVHTGRLYGKRIPLKFLKAVENFLENNVDAQEECEFTFAGFSDDVSIDSFQKFPYKAVKFLGPVSFEESISLQRRAHILVSIDADEKSQLYDLFFPSKILDYMLTNKRILALTPQGSTCSMILSLGHGNSFEHDSLEDIVEFLNIAYSEYKKKNTEFFKVPLPPDIYSAKHNVENLSNLFSKLL